MSEPLTPLAKRRQLFAQRVALAVRNAKQVLKPGDRIRVAKCPGTKRWITFARWDGNFMVSKSGIDDYSPFTVDRVNAQSVDFSAVEFNAEDFIAVNTAAQQPGTANV
jgi:hypothetical protein